MEADALSTIVFMFSPARSIEMIESMAGVEAMIIREDLGIILSSGLNDKIRLEDDDFYLVNLSAK